MNAFATFFILSYVKIMNVSFDILTLSNAYYESGNKAEVKFLFINGSMTPFSKEHTPYAALAIFMFLIFNLFPLVLLCVYLSRCFQKFLNCTKCQYWTLHNISSQTRSKDATRKHQGTADIFICFSDASI